VALVIAIPIMGHLSDRYGRRPLLLLCCAAFIILPWPLFTYLASGNVPYVVLVLIQIGIAVVISLYSGAGPAAIAEVFPTRSRSTWMTTGYALAVAIFGGSAPYLSIWMIGKLGSPIAPVWYLIASAIVSFFVIWNLKETAFDELA
jgi:MHS family proline/betaine transporter-like MFS transporter